MQIYGLNSGSNRPTWGVGQGVNKITAGSGMRMYDMATGNPINTTWNYQLPGGMRVGTINYPTASGSGAGGALSTSSGSLSASSTSSGPTSPRIPEPSLQNFSYSQESQSYPAYLRNLGELMANQQFETAVNQGLRAGNAAQGYQRALDQRNMNRLQYMGQAGQHELGIQKALADEIARRNDEFLKRYGISVGQRGQDVDYSTKIDATKLASSMAGGGWSPTVGGALRGASTGRSSGGVDLTGSGSYIGLGGRTSPYQGFSGTQLRWSPFDATQSPSLPGLPMGESSSIRYVGSNY